MSTWQIRDATAIEWLDADTTDSRDLERNLSDIRRINALLGWTTFTSHAVTRWMRREPQKAWSLLDVASGSADIPIAIAQSAARAGIDLHITATDRNPEIVAIARRQSASVRAIQVEQQDALALPYATGSFDIALCTLALHHFAPDDARALLRSLAHVGRRIIVCDVVRSPLAYAGVVALTRLGRMHPMTCHDGPASVRRAYSAGEVRALAADAGLRRAEVHVGFPFRLMLVADGAVPIERDPYAV